MRRKTNELEHLEMDIMRCGAHAATKEKSIPNACHVSIVICWKINYVSIEIKVDFYLFALWLVNVISFDWKCRKHVRPVSWKWSSRFCNNTKCVECTSNFGENSIWLHNIPHKITNCAHTKDMIANCFWDLPLCHQMHFTSHTLNVMRDASKKGANY